MNPEKRVLSESEKVVTKQMFGSSDYKTAKKNTMTGKIDYVPNGGGVIKRIKNHGIHIDALSDGQQAEAYRLDFKMERARRYNALGIFSLVLGLPSLLAWYSDRQVFLTGVGLTIIGAIVVPLFLKRIRSINRELTRFVESVSTSK